MAKLVEDVVGACLALNSDTTIFNELQDRLGSEVALLLQLLQGSANEPASSVWANMHEWAIQEGRSYSVHSWPAFLVHSQSVIMVSIHGYKYIIVSIDNLYIGVIYNLYIGACILVSVQH